MKNLYDLIVIGAGPAGLAAAIYAGRAKLKTLVLEQGEPGGQVKITDEVANYPGVLSASGKQLSLTMKQQAQSFGAEFATETVTAVNLNGNIKRVNNYETLAVIIAAGAKPRKLGFNGETEFAGRGIAYCATCDGEFFTGKTVFVIGAGFAAAEEALYMTRYAKRVCVIARGADFTCSKTIADKVLAHPKIEVKFNTEIKYARGGRTVNEAGFITSNISNNSVAKNNAKSGGVSTEWAHKENGLGIFIFAGYEPESGLFKEFVSTNSAGYILTDEDMQTGVPGVYAAGDIRPKRLRQLVTATADGAIAATAAEKYIDEKKRELGIATEAPKAVKQKQGAAGGGAPAPAAGKKAKPIDGSNTQPHGEDKAQPLLTDEVGAQIEYVLQRCTDSLTVNAILTDDAFSQEMRGFLSEFSRFTTSKIDIKTFKPGEHKTLEAQLNTSYKKLLGKSMFPVIALTNPQGFTGVSFNAVPGGHELESFILAIYNAAGPGQAIDGGLAERIKALAPRSIIVGVSLSCTMCPATVQAAHRIALLNKGITASMADLGRLPALREKFGIMSVPAVIIDGTQILFGKKNLEELVDNLRLAP